MRLAIILARVMANNIKTTDAAMVFHAATVGGAKSLLRDDLGKLEAGAKADLVLVDLTQTIMRPAHDPLKSLIYHGADRAVKTVFIDGELVVDDGKVVHLDMADAVDWRMPSSACLRMYPTMISWAVRRRILHLYRLICNSLCSSRRKAYFAS